MYWCFVVKYIQGIIQRCWNIWCYFLQWPWLAPHNYWNYKSTRSCPNSDLSSAVSTYQAAVIAVQNLSSASVRDDFWTRKSLLLIRVGIPSKIIISFRSFHQWLHQQKPIQIRIVTLFENTSSRGRTDKTRNLKKCRN